jgi:hypothetical protein
MNRQTLAIDFDGVICVNGEVTPGFWEWAREADKQFELAVFSARSASPMGRREMMRWMRKEWHKTGRSFGMPPMSFPKHKPTPWLSIDDRAVTFKGDWSEMSVQALQSFRPWTQTGEHNGSQAA